MQRQQLLTSLFCTVVFGVLLGVLFGACREDDSRLYVSGEPPYYETLEQVAAAASASVQGTVVAQVGKFDVPASDVPLAMQVYTFRVETVIGQVGGGTLEPGQTIHVSMAAASERPHVGNMEEFRSEIESYSSPLEVGSRLILFLAPHPERETVAGWSVVGSNYGVVSETTEGLHWKAPHGHLSSQLIRESDLLEAMDALGDRVEPPSAIVPVSPITEAPIPKSGPPR